MCKKNKCFFLVICNQFKIRHHYISAMTSDFKLNGERYFFHSEIEEISAVISEPARCGVSLRHQMWNIITQTRRPVKKRLAKLTTLQEVKRKKSFLFGQVKVRCLALADRILTTSVRTRIIYVCAMGEASFPGLRFCIHGISRCAQEGNPRHGGPRQRPQLIRSAEMVRSSDGASLCKKARAANARSEYRSQHHIPYEHAHPKGHCWACLCIYSLSVSDRGRMPLAVCLLDHNRTRELTKLPVLCVDEG